MTEWPTVHIEEIAEKVAMGPFGSNIKVETFVSAGVPIISGQHLHNSRLDESGGYKFITEEHADRLANSNVFPGDIVFTHAGTIGQVALIPAAAAFDRYVISQRQFYLRVDLSKADPAFVTRWFQSAVGRHRLLMHASQVGVPSISRPASNLKTIEIELPTLREQKAISTILDVLDDKIDLNRRINETLEAMARAIFKDWFVDFGPTRSKVEGRTPYLVPELWELFPDMLDGEDKPVGWEFGTIGDVAKVKSGKRPPTKLKVPDGAHQVPVYGGNGVSWHTNKTLYDPPFLITGRVGTLGTVFRVYDDVWVSDNALCCFPIKREYFELLFLHLKSLDYDSLNSGSTQPLLTQSALIAQKVVIGEQSIRDAFSGCIRPLFSRILHNTRESQILASVRDFLLPRLMSGEICLRDAEKAVEAVA